MVRFLPKDHEIVRQMEETCATYVKKEKAQEVKGKLGSPHVQLFAALVAGLQNSWSVEKFPGNVRLAGVPQRLLAALQRNTDPVEVEEWVKACGISPTYEGKKKRVTLHVNGQIRVGTCVEEAEELVKKEEQEGLASFLELPLPLPSKGLVMTLEKALVMMLRDVGAEARSGKAPPRPTRTWHTVSGPCGSPARPGQRGSAYCTCSATAGAAANGEDVRATSHRDRLMSAMRRGLPVARARLTDSS